MTKQIDTAETARVLTIEELAQVSGGHNPPGYIVAPHNPPGDGRGRDVPPDPY